MKNAMKKLTSLLLVALLLVGMIPFGASAEELSAPLVNITVNNQFIQNVDGTLGSRASYADCLLVGGVDTSKENVTKVIYNYNGQKDVTLNEGESILLDANAVCYVYIWTEPKQVQIETREYCHLCGELVVGGSVHCQTCDKCGKQWCGSHECAPAQPVEYALSIDVDGVQKVLTSGTSTSYAECLKAAGVDTTKVNVTSASWQYTDENGVKSFTFKDGDVINMVADTRVYFFTEKKAEPEQKPETKPEQNKPGKDDKFDKDNKPGKGDKFDKDDKDHGKPGNKPNKPNKPSNYPIFDLKDETLAKLVVLENNTKVWETSGTPGTSVSVNECLSYAKINSKKVLSVSVSYTAGNQVAASLGGTFSLGEAKTVTVLKFVTKKSDLIGSNDSGYYKISGNVKLWVILDGVTREYDIKSNIAADGKVTLNEVKTFVKDYYNAIDTDTGIIYDGIYPQQGNFYLAYALDQKYNTIDGLYEAANNSDYVVLKVFLRNAKLATTTSTSTSTADTSNPKTGDSIHTAMTVMGISAAALASVMYFYNKKRMAM